MALTPKTKQKTRAKTPDKRRVGRHHKHDGHYTKAYWPYLPLALLIGVGIFANSVWGSVHKGVLGYATDVSVGALLQGTNQQREGNGLGDLSLNSQLDQAAQAKANDMAARDYWSHNTPDGVTPWTFITNAGYTFQTAGENLAYGFDTSSNTVTAWMNSPEHRANILNNTYVDVGFGIANVANYQGTGQETIVVAEYASPQQVAAAPAPSAASGSGSSALPKAAATTPAATAASPTPALSTSADPPASNSNAATNAASNANPSTSKTVASAKPASEEHITRLQLLSHSQNASWSVLAVSAIATACVAVFLLRHAFAWHRLLVKGEKLIVKHKFLDLGLVGVAILGVLLTRTVGLIR